MGIFDIFKSKPSKEAIFGQVRKAKEVYAQPEYRRMAMEKLLKWGTPEALAGILERFLVVVQSPHWDEDEKRWLVEELVKVGDKSLPVLKDFILKKNEVNHALCAYRKIVADDQNYKALLIEALKSRPPSDHRSVQGKQELIAALSEFNDPNLNDLILPYFNDHSDDVQCAAIAALANRNEAAIDAHLIELLKSDNHSARVLRSAANVVVNKQITLPKDVQLAEVVKEDFAIEAGHLKRLHQEALE